jgi:hypothetical protein
MSIKEAHRFRAKVQVQVIANVVDYSLSHISGRVKAACHNGVRGNNRSGEQTDNDKEKRQVLAKNTVVDSDLAQGGRKGSEQGSDHKSNKQNRYESFFRL